MVSDTKAIKKLKKKYSQSSPRLGFRKSRSKILNYLPVSVVVWGLKKFLIKSDYRLKRDSKTYFELCNRAYDAKKTRKTDRLLVIALNLLGLEKLNSFSVLLRNAVKSTLENPQSRGAISDSVLLATKNLENTFFDATSWYQLSRGLFYLGFFRAAWVSRENSLNLSIAEGSNLGSSATAISRAVEAHLERLNIDSVRKLLSESNVLGAKALESFRELSDLVEGKVVADSDSKIGKYCGSVQLFHELVSGKKVVLVGAGPAHGVHGFEIDSAETVARIKYPGSEYLLDEKLFGKRCDISQYPGLEPLRELAKISSYEYFDDLRLIVAGGTDSRAVRNTPVFCEDQEMPMYRTTVTSGLRLLISMIRRRPSSLKIFGFGFYTEREPYNFGMKSFYERESWKMGNGYLLGTRKEFPKSHIALNSGDHDPVSNFCFAQNLYKAGLFDIEPYGKSILELTPYQYVERLEEMLGDW